MRSGKVKKPVMLKRALSGQIEEWLLAAEYILAQGNPNVILCERGIRTFETAYRNTFDINAIPLVKELSHLPDYRRPEPRHRQVRPGRAGRDGRHRRRRRRAHDRGASQPGPRPQRRRAIVDI